MEDVGVMLTSEAIVVCGGGRRRQRGLVAYKLVVSLSYLHHLPEIMEKLTPLNSNLLVCLSLRAELLC